MGETCGMKLVLDTYQQPNKCRLCEKYDVKLRKREAECERLKLRQSEGKNPCANEKAYTTIAQLDDEIRALYAELYKRRSCYTASSLGDRGTGLTRK
jgi:hypothetical protein